MTVTATQTQNPEVPPMPGQPGQPGQPGPPGSRGRASTGSRSADRRSDMVAALRPLLIDVGIPVGTYYLLRNAFGVSLWLSLALSSIGPAVRAVASLVAERTLNVLAMLMLAVN